jgi:hypothetical protein
VVPGVVSWAAFAVFVEAHGENVWVSGFALGMGIATGLAAVGYLLRSAAAMYERHKENERRSVALVVTHRRPY